MTYLKTSRASIVDSFVIRATIIYFPSLFCLRLLILLSDDFFLPIIGLPGLGHPICLVSDVSPVLIVSSSCFLFRYAKNEWKGTFMSFVFDLFFIFCCWWQILNVCYFSFISAPWLWPKQGRIYGNPCRGRLGRGSNGLGRGIKGRSHTKSKVWRTDGPRDRHKRQKRPFHANS